MGLMLCMSILCCKALWLMAAMLWHKVLKMQGVMMGVARCVGSRPKRELHMPYGIDAMPCHRCPKGTNMYVFKQESWGHEAASCPLAAGDAVRQRSQQQQAMQLRPWHSMCVTDEIMSPPVSAHSAALLHRQQTTGCSQCHTGAISDYLRLGA